MNPFLQEKYRHCLHTIDEAQVRERRALEISYLRLNLAYALHILAAHSGSERLLRKTTQYAYRQEYELEQKIAHQQKSTEKEKRIPIVI